MGVPGKKAGLPSQRGLHRGGGTLGLKGDEFLGIGGLGNGTGTWLPGHKRTEAVGAWEELPCGRPRRQCFWRGRQGCAVAVSPGAQCGGAMESPEWGVTGPEQWLRPSSEDGWDRETWRQLPH